MLVQSHPNKALLGVQKNITEEEPAGRLCSEALQDLEIYGR